MKKKLILLFFLLVPIANLLLYSCGCDVERFINYTHKSMSLKNLDNGGKQAVESGFLKFNKNAYGIRLHLQIEEKEVVARAKQINSIFVQSANATSVEPCPYVYQAIDSIVSMKVFTINDFDNLHTANSEITGYFKVAQAYLSVDNYVSNLTHSQVHRDNGRFTRDGKIEIDLMLMTAPTTSNKHQFKVRVELSDGRVFEEQTAEISLL